jgi:hypothetical protein
MTIADYVAVPFDWGKTVMSSLPCAADSAILPRGI